MPFGVVTVTFTAPRAPSGATAVICVLEIGAKLTAGVLPKSTDVAPLRLLPKIVTVLPPFTPPTDGLRKVTNGSKE